MPPGVVGPGEMGEYDCPPPEDEEANVDDMIEVPP